MEGRDEFHQREVERLNEHVGEQRRENAALRAEVAALRTENAVLRQRLDDHLTRVEETDRRRWTLLGLVFGAVLTFVANLVVALTRR